MAISMTAFSGTGSPGLTSGKRMPAGRIGTIGAMRRYTSLTDDQYRLLLGYVQNHARDMGAKEIAK